MYRLERCLLDDTFMESTVAIFLTQGLVLQEELDARLLGTWRVFGKEGLWLPLGSRCLRSQLASKVWRWFVPLLRFGLAKELVPWI